MWLGKFINRALLTIIFSVTVLSLSACGRTARAPVSSAQIPAYYIVNRGETLYSIAFRYGLDYRKVAKLNHIGASYKIKYGQRLYLNAPAVKTSFVKQRMINTKPTTTKRSVANPPAKPLAMKAFPKISWQWPTKGRVISVYSPSVIGNNGIDITGQFGQPIYAAASGYVVYCGSGLRGYGQLIIIKHSDVILSAYAHNSQLLVKEGMYIKAGQQIAKMGNSDSNRIKLHFEIRNAGKPVNPANYLPKH